MKRSGLPAEERDKVPLPRKGESQEQYYKRVHGVTIQAPKGSGGGKRGKEK